MKAPTDDQSLALSESLGPVKTEAFVFSSAANLLSRYVTGPPSRHFGEQVVTNPLAFPWHAQRRARTQRHRGEMERVSIRQVVALSRMLDVWNGVISRRMLQLELQGTIARRTSHEVALPSASRAQKALSRPAVRSFFASRVRLLLVPSRIAVDTFRHNRIGVKRSHADMIELQLLYLGGCATS